MGAYIYINEEDRIRMRKAFLGDRDVQGLLAEALEYDNSLLILCYEKIVKESFFGKKTVEKVYEIYHDVDPLKPPYQARWQISASGTKSGAMCYLYGIINGAIAQTTKTNLEINLK
jgi:hypothetical protein